MGTEVALLAQMQLAAWEEYAKVWPINNNAHQMICGPCGGAIVRWVDGNGIPYTYTDHEVMALIVGHLRNVHRDREAEVYRNAGFET